MAGREELECEEEDPEYLFETKGSQYQHIGRGVRRIRWLDRETRSTQFLTVGHNDCDSGGQIALWDFNTSSRLSGSVGSAEPLTLRMSAKLESGANELVSSSNGCLVGLSNGDVVVFSNGDGQILQKHVFTGISNVGGSVEALTTNNDVLVSGFDTGLIAVVDCASGTASTVAHHLPPVTCTTFVTPSTFASSHLSGQLYLWDLRCERDVGITRPVNSCASRNNASVNSVAVHPADSTLVTFGTEDSYVGFWDVRTRGTVNSSSLIPPMPFIGSVAEVGFHPQYPSNLYALFCEGELIHFTVSDSNPNDSWTATASTLGEEKVSSRINPWLNTTQRAPRMSSLVTEMQAAMNSFDVSQSGLLISTDFHSVFYVSKNYFA